MQTGKFMHYRFDRNPKNIRLATFGWKNSKKKILFLTPKRGKSHHVYRVKTDSTNCIWNQSGQIDTISFVNRKIASR